MYQKLLNIIHFVLLFTLYIFIKYHSSEEEVFDIISFSYPTFLRIVDLFTWFMYVKGKGRWR